MADDKKKSTQKPEKESQIAVEQPKTDAEKLAAMAAMEFTGAEVTPQESPEEFVDPQRRAFQGAISGAAGAIKGALDFTPGEVGGRVVSGFFPTAQEQRQSKPFIGPTQPPAPGPAFPEAIGPKRPKKKKGKSAAAPVTAPPSVSSSAADFSMFNKEQAGSRSSALREKLDALLAAASEQPAPSQPRQFTRGQRIAAALLAGIDPARYQLLVAPEIERRQREHEQNLSQNEAERQRNIDVAKLGVEIEQTLQALEREEELDAQQLAVEQFMFEGLQEGAASSIREADEILALVPSEAGRRRVRNARNSVARMRGLFPPGAVTEATASLFGQSIDFLRGLVQQELRLQGSGLSEKEQETLRDTTQIMNSLAQVRELIADDAFYGSGREGGWIGEKYASVKDFLGASQDLSQLQTIKMFFSTITGTINRTMGGGAALSEFEASLLEGMFLTTDLPQTTKLARIDALTDFMAIKMDMIQGSPLNPQTGQRAGPTSNQQSDEALLRASGVDLDRDMVGTGPGGGKVYRLPSGELVEML